MALNACSSSPGPPALGCCGRAGAAGLGMSFVPHTHEVTQAPAQGEAIRSKPVTQPVRPSLPQPWGVGSQGAATAKVTSHQHDTHGHPPGRPQLSRRAGAPTRPLHHQFSPQGTGGSLCHGGRTAPTPTNAAGGKAQPKKKQRFTALSESDPSSSTHPQHARTTHRPARATACSCSPPSVPSQQQPGKPVAAVGTHGAGK